MKASEMASHVDNHQLGFQAFSAIRDTLETVCADRKESIAAVYLFGSLVTNSVLPSSDIDLAILLTNRGEEETADARFTLYADCSRALKRNDIDIVLLNRMNNLILLDEIVRNGMLVFDGDTELREDFEARILHDCMDFRRQRLLTIGM